MNFNKGTLYLVSTPIGNLKDITIRALEILKSSNYIFSETTGKAHLLLKHFSIGKKVHLYQEKNKRVQIKNILDILSSGKDVALITDAGTPSISDPGYELVNEALEKGLKVSPIPGPSALTASLSLSGIDVNRFVFEGFLPKKRGRRAIVESFRNELRPILFFESPNRVVDTLKEIREVTGEVYVIIIREITKIYESIIRANITELIDYISKDPLKGEIVVIISKLGR